MLLSCGVRLESEGLSTTLYPPAAAGEPALEVPGDFSSAAFFIVAGLLGAARGGFAASQRRTESDAHRPARYPAQHGRRHRNPEPAPAAAPNRWRICGCRPRRCTGIAVPAALVPLAIDEFPVLFVAAACASGETRGHGRGGIARQGKRSDCGHERRLQALGVAHEVAARRHADRGPPARAPPSAAARSTASATIGSPWPLASRACGPPRAIRFATWPMSRPPFRASSQLARVGGSRPRGIGEPHGARMNKVPVITIDGPSGSGKGTVSRAAARAPRLGAARQRCAVPLGRPGGRGGPVSAWPTRPAWPAWPSRSTCAFGSAAGGRGNRLARRYRTSPATSAPRRRAMTPPRWPPCPPVRAALLERQRRFAVAPGLVADGRDMGTVVFPAAQVKIFLTASADERARRRHKQLKEKGVAATLAALSLEIAERDHARY